MPTKSTFLLCYAITESNMSLYWTPPIRTPLPSQHNPTSPSVIVNNEEEWHVKEVLDSRIFHRCLQYKIKWVGYNKSDCEPAENVNKLEAVDCFHQRYPDKPGPLLKDQ